MRCSQGHVVWLGLAAGVLWVSAGRAIAQPPATGSPEESRKPTRPARSAAEPRPSVPDLQATLRRIPLDQVAPAQREAVRKVLEQPTLFGHGPLECFPGRMDLYQSLLDRPDLAAQAWRRLGAPCSEITNRGKGGFSWTDGSGTEMTWQTVLANDRLRVWLAEGKVRPGLLMPTVPVQAVVVLRYAEVKDRSGKPLLRHQADVFVQTDSKTAALVARMLGPSVPQMAEQCLGQLEMFFSALVWYCEAHPERMESVFGQQSRVP
jgi:hypothetical protein